jgi:phosphoribosylanthranilate isomerase
VPDPVLVKVCGLTDPQEAAACADLGAWAIGLVFAAESLRRVSPAAARRIVDALPAGVRKVGVFVDPPPDEAAEIAEACGLTDVQVHGAAADVAAIRAACARPVFQGFPVADAASLEAARRSAADLVLLDAAIRGRHGGTGTTFDWALIEGVDLGRPFALAGGLTPGNVTEAVRRARPAVVDVSSGVERAPGRKDPALVRAFIQGVRDGAMTRGAA